MVHPPVEPPRTSWLLDAARAEPGEDLVAAGADLQPGTLLAAYRLGLFPMGLGPHGGGTTGWWSPDPRGVIPAGGLRVRRSLVSPAFYAAECTSARKLCSAPYRYR